MAMSNTVDAFNTVINTCTDHQSGNGRECVWYAESENYSANTLETKISSTSGSH